MRAHPTLALVLALPSATAGTPEAPEIVDPVGDCQFAPANHYADIVAGWIGEEIVAETISQTNPVPITICDLAETTAA